MNLELQAFKQAKEKEFESILSEKEAIQNENDALKSELFHMRQFLEEKEAIYEETLHNIEALKSENSEILKQNAEIESHLHECEFIIQTNDIRIKELEEITGVQKSLRTENSQDFFNETPNFKKSEDFNMIIQQKDKEISDLQQEIEQVKGFSSLKNEENKILQENLGNLQQNYNKILAKLNQKDDELSRFGSEKNQTKAFEGQILTLKEHNKELQFQNEELIKENQRILAEMSNIPKENEDPSENLQNEYKSILARYQLLTNEYEEINGMIREMINEFFPSEHCSESHSTRTLLLKIQRIIRQKKQEEDPEEEENFNGPDENGSARFNVKEQTNEVQNLEEDFNKDDDMENEIEEYRMIITHMEIALKDKDKEIHRLNKILNGKDLVLTIN